MDYIRLYNEDTKYQSDLSEKKLSHPNVSYTEDEQKVYYEPVDIKQLTVKQLIDEGYAVKNSDGSIQIHSNCPYKMGQISDFYDILSNNKQIDEGVNNTFVWRESLPEGWNLLEIIDAYNHMKIQGYVSHYATLFSGVDCHEASSITFTFAGETQASAVGIDGLLFATNQNWSQNFSPSEITYFTNAPISSFSFPFGGCGTTKKIVLGFPSAKYTGTHTMNGTFMNSGIEEIINGTDDNHKGIEWYKTSDLRWAFLNCKNLKEIPSTYGITDRYSLNNEIFPRKTTVRGYSSLWMFCNGCSNLSKIGPVLNLSTIIPTTGDSGNITGSFGNCKKLTDVRIKGLSNGDWDFTKDPTEIPNMDVESLTYLLNNVSSHCSANYGISDYRPSGEYADYDFCYIEVDDGGNKLYYTDDTKSATTTDSATTVDGEIVENKPVYTIKSKNDNGVDNFAVTPETEGFSITLSSLHKDEIDPSAIANAESKGWKIIFK